MNLARFTLLVWMRLTRSWTALKRIHWPTCSQLLSSKQYVHVITRMSTHRVQVREPLEAAKYLDSLFRSSGLEGSNRTWPLGKSNRLLL